MLVFLYIIYICALGEKVFVWSFIIRDKSSTKW